MPRPKKGPHLWLKRRERFKRQSVWIIVDGRRETSTGCGAGELEKAEQSLQAYIAGKYTPPKTSDRLDAIHIGDVMNVYISEHAPTVAEPDFIKYTAAPIIRWWGAKTLADIRSQTCREYAAWRTGEGVSDQTARHDLKTLRAAMNYYHREYGPLPSVPAITMPDKAPPRERWLTRREAAAMIRAARARPHTRHLARMVLIGAYTGTRSKAMLRLKWLPSPSGGWFDLADGILYRRGQGERETKKRRTPARIPVRLLPHLRRWRALDMEHEGSTPIVHVVHYFGRPIGKLRRSWDAVRRACGMGEDVVPHTLRHTAATWLMQAGIDIHEAAGFLGMSAKTLEEVYGHHHTDFQVRAASAQYKRGTGPGSDRITVATGRQLPAKSGTQRQPRP